MSKSKQKIRPIDAVALRKEFEMGVNIFNGICNLNHIFHNIDTAPTLDVESLVDNSNYENKCIKFSFKPNDIVYHIVKKQDKFGYFLDEYEIKEGQVSSCNAYLDQYNFIIEYEAEGFPDDLFSEYLVGITVFRTRKEAERKIKELNNNASS